MTTATAHEGRRHSRGGPASTLAWLWLAVVVLGALSASWLPLDPHRQDLGHSRAGPSWSHPFGTTRLGEDLLARVVHGSRVSLVVAVVATTVALALGGLLGMAAATVGRWLDSVVMVAVDAAAAFPPLVLAMAMVLFRGPGLFTITVTLAALATPAFARVARTATQEVIHRDFVLAARAGGSRTWRLMTREVLPNIRGPLAGYGLIVAGVMMLVEGALSFLGLGVGTDKTSWGQLVAAGQGEVGRAPHLSLFPALALSFTVAALSHLGDQRSRGGAGVKAGSLTPRRIRLRRATAHPAFGPLAQGGPVDSPPPRLEVRELSTVLHTANGRLAVVRQASFTVGAGELLGLAGESGSGKSTLAASLVALAPFAVAAEISGSVLLDGEILFDQAHPARSSDRVRAARGRGIAHILQDPLTALDPVMRVGHQIAEMARVHGGANRRQAAAQAVELLERVDVADAAQRARRFPHELSGGQRQRVALAMALAAGPSVLVADEATSALDVITQSLLLDRLDELRHRQGLAVLLISHDLRLLAGRADRIAVLYAGRIVEIGPAGALYHQPAMPYTAALIAASPTMSAAGASRLATIDGQAPDPSHVAAGCSFAPRCSRAQPRCDTELPRLRPASPASPDPANHEVACFFPLTWPPSPLADGTRPTR